MPAIHTSSLDEALGSPNDIDALDLKLAGPTLPDEIFELRNLRQLVIRGGTLTKVSPRLAELDKLTYLGLDKQPKLDLTDFPVMPALVWLSLRNCKLRALPATIFACHDLETLSLGMNPLKTVPAGISALHKLTTLYLWGCGLKDVSPELGRLTRLVVLELEKNALTTLPAELAALTELRHLHIECNAFEVFPDVVCELTQLRKLVAFKNRITTLPDAVARLTRLTTLRLEDNPIRTFPADLSMLTELETFYVSLGITKDELKRQVHHLPPRAFIMSFADGDLARDGRWADAPARSSLEIAADAVKLAAGSEDDSAEATHAANAASVEAVGEQIFHFENRVHRVAFVPGGVVGAGYDSMRAFDLPGGKPRFHATGYHHQVATSPDGTQLLVGADRTALHDPRTGAVHAKLPVKSGYLANWSADGKVILLYDDGDLCCLDGTTHEVLQRLAIGRTTFAVLTPDGQRVLYGAEKSVRLWDRTTGKEVFRTRVTRFGVVHARFSPDGRHVFVLTVGELLRLDLGQKKPKPEILLATQAGAFDLLPDGRHAVLGGPAISIVDLTTGQTTATLGAHEDVGPVDCIVVSPDGAQVASCGCDRTVRVWQLPRA